MTGRANPAAGRWGPRLLAIAVAVVLLAVVTIVTVVLGSTGSGSGPAALPGGPAQSCTDGPVPDPPPVPSAQSEPVVTYAVGASYWDQTALGQNLSLTAFADGTVVVADGIGGYPGGEPHLYLGWVGPCAVAAAADRLAGAGGADFGLPGVADASTAVIDVHPADLARRVHLEVYALDPGGTILPPGSGAEARDTVEDALRDLQDATHRVPWTPDRFRAQWSDGFTRMVGPQVTPWPLTTPIVELLGPNGCAEVPRSTAQTLIDAQPERSVVGQWTDPTKTTVVALSVLMPGEPACPPRPTPWR